MMKWIAMIIRSVAGWLAGSVTKVMLRKSKKTVELLSDSCFMTI